MHRFLTFIRPLAATTHRFLAVSVVRDTRIPQPHAPHTGEVSCDPARDGRAPIKRSAEHCNFYVYYQVHDNEVPTALLLEEYDGVRTTARGCSSRPPPHDAASAHARRWNWMDRTSHSQKLSDEHDRCEP